MISSTELGGRDADYWRANRDKLFLASCIALIVTAMSFAIRGALISPLGEQFRLSKGEIGSINQMAFWGFTLAMIIGGPLCDVLGMGKLMVLAFVGHIVGILLTIFAHDYWTLWISTLSFGLGNGFVEAVCNPLIATLYPDQKIKRLNLFHVWFPGGIVIGGLASYAVTQLGLGGKEHGWQIQMATMLLPLAIYVALFFGKRFPKTERVASGVSMGAMFSECLRPGFLLFVFAMCLTAMTELGPGQWITNIVGVTTGAAGILFTVWQNGLMAVGRTSAGQIVHRISPIAVLLTSACFALIGLYALSIARSPLLAGVAITLFAVGVCFFWPTMLGTVSERFPKTGSLGLAIMGGMGMLASGKIQPLIGNNYDAVTNQQAYSYVQASADPRLKAAFTAEKGKPDTTPEMAAGKALSEAAGKDEAAAEVKSAWAQAQADGGAAGIKSVLFMPVILIFVFGGLFLTDKAKGGYRKEVLIQDQV